MKTGKYILLGLFLFAICWNVVAQDVAVFPQLGHFSHVDTVEISPDNKFILSANIVGGGGAVKLWDVNTGREIRNITERYSGSTTFSPNGKFILISNIQELILWEINTGSERWKINANSDKQITGAQFCDNGRRIISKHQYDNVKIWDTDTGREIKTIDVRNGSKIILSPDGRKLITRTDNNLIKIWDTITGQEIRTISGFTDNIHVIEFNPDGNNVLIGLQEGTLKLLNIMTDREINEFVGHTSSVSSVVFNYDGRLLVSCSESNKVRTIKIWDVTNGKEIRTLTYTAKNSGTIVEFSPDGRQIVARIGQEIKIWDTSTGREIKTISWLDGPWMPLVKYTQDGRQIIFHIGNDIKIINLSDGREIRTLTHNPHVGGNIITAFALSNDKKLIVSASDREMKIWDIATGRKISELTWYSNEVNFVSYHPDGKHVIGSHNGSLKLWNIFTGREVRTFTNGLYGAPIAFSPDGKQVVSVEWDFTNIKIWETDTGKEIKIFTGHTHPVTSLAYSPDGRQIVSCAGGYEGDQLIKLWDVNTGQEIINIAGHSKEIQSVAFSPDGRRIVSGSSDNTVKIWDATTGREIRSIQLDSLMGGTYVSFDHSGRMIISLLTHQKNVGDGIIVIYEASTGREIWRIENNIHDGLLRYYINVKLSPDGRYLLTNNINNEIKIFDINTRQEIKNFSSNNVGVIIDSDFSPDGKNIITGAMDGTIRIWDVDTCLETAQFISFTDGEWIVLTPDGYYNASPNGDKYLNVRVGNNVYGIDQYRLTFYRPNIVEARLQGKPDPVQVTATIQQAGEPPVVTIRSPVNGARLTTRQTELSVLIESRQPIRNIQILVNGRPVTGNEMRGIRGIRGVDLEATRINLNEPVNRQEFSVNINLENGNNLIEVIATNPHEGRASVEATTTQGTTQTTTAVQSSLPNLWVLAIGVNRYNSPLLDDLRFAVNDAREILNVFRAQEGRVYNRVNSRLLADGEALTPTKRNIIDGLDFLKEAEPNDTVILFIAGHGILDQNGSFFFMPSDASFNANGSIRSADAVSFREIQSVQDGYGRKIILIDACHSAGGNNNTTRVVDNTRLVRDLESHGSVVLTSSKGDQFSQERADIRHGVFTYAILQGLRGEAQQNNGVISMTALHLFVTNKVRELTNNQQEPVFGSPGYTDFPVARFR